MPGTTLGRIVSGLADKRTHGSQAAELGSDQRGEVEARERPPLADLGPSAAADD